MPGEHVIGNQSVGQQVFELEGTTPSPLTYSFERTKFLESIYGAAIAMVIRFGTKDWTQL